MNDLQWSMIITNIKQKLSYSLIFKRIETIKKDIRQSVDNMLNLVLIIPGK